jgi:ATP-dependent RNA helicase DHX8/PRP22
MRSAWVEEVLPRLRNIDVQRLSGGATTRHAKARAEEQQQEVSIEDVQHRRAVSRQKKDTAAIDAARQRYLARKSSRGR